MYCCLLLITRHYTTARKENDFLRPPHSGQTQSQSFYLIKVGSVILGSDMPTKIFQKVVDLLDDHLNFKFMVCISSGQEKSVISL